MAYKVERNEYKRELFEGEFPVIIDSYELKSWNYMGIDLGRYNLKLIVSEGEFKGSWLFDAIFEQVKEGNDYAEWDQTKMNKYSGALQIPVGTEFNTIEEWLEYIVGKEVVAVVKIKNGYQRVSYVKPLREEEISNPDLNF